MSQDFIERLHNPNFAIVEQHFGHPVPAALRQLHANREELDRSDFTITVGADSKQFRVGDYTPIDEHSLQFFPDFENLLDIANDASEGLYLIDPTQVDPEVLQFDVETYELTPCGCALSEFLTAPRRAGPPTEEETE